MIKFIFILIAIIIIEALVIILLAFLLKRKREKMIKDFNNDVIDREKILNQIDNKTQKEKEALVAKIKKSNTIDDLKRLFISL